MDVEHAAGVTGNERCAENAHEAGEHDEIRLALVDDGGERGVEGIAIGEVPVLDNRRGDAVRERNRERGRLAAIADHRRDRSGEAAVALGCEERGEIRAAAGGEDGDARDCHGGRDLGQRTEAGPR